MEANSKDSNADSSSVNNQDDPSHQGNDDVSSDRTLKEVMAENQRKSEKIQSLETKIESFESRLTELDIIAHNRGLTGKENAEADKLKDDVETAARKLREQEDSKPWVHISRQEAERAAVEIATANEIERGNDYLEDKAYELKIPIAELVEKLKPYSANKQGMTLYRRNVEAFRAFQRESERVKSLEAREAKIKAKEDEEIRFRETGTRLPRNTEHDDRFEKAKTAKDRNSAFVDLMDTNPAQVSILK